VGEPEGRGRAMDQLHHSDHAAGGAEEEPGGDGDGSLSRRSSYSGTFEASGGDGGPVVGGGREQVGAEQHDVEAAAGRGRGARGRLGNELARVPGVGRGRSWYEGVGALGGGLDRLELGDGSRRRWMDRVAIDESASSTGWYGLHRDSDGWADESGCSEVEGGRAGGLDRSEGEDAVH
jgi:hypothetical protein